MNSKGASYPVYILVGFVFAALFRVWEKTGFDMSMVHTHPDTAGILGFGAAGAVVGFVICWFL